MNWVSKLFGKSETSGAVYPKEPFTIPDWLPRPQWDEKTLQLLKEFSVENLRKETQSGITAKSKEFPIDFPIGTSKCEYLRYTKNVPEEVLNRNIDSAYPLIHESVLKLCCDFILFKRSHGSKKEQSFYSQIGVKDLVNRLISKRAVCFLGSYDKYMLLDKTTGNNQWDTIGKDTEAPPLVIDQYLSYDELKLSALLSISSYTYFINEGNRTNGGKYEEDRTKVEPEGIIVGMVGPRLHRSNAVEYQEILLTEKQNTKENGFGLSIENSIPKLFAKFYEEKCLNYNELLNIVKKDKSGRYFEDFRYFFTFDNMLYYKRLTISIDTLLGEANSRAKASSQLAWLHVIGIGLGVWKKSAHQDELFMNVFAKRITSLGEKLNHISDIYFAYIDSSKCGEWSDGELYSIPNHPEGGIRIHMGKREPHVNLEGPDKGKLLVVSYAWDGNALPGNEYWFGSLTSSSDPAAACSTQVAEIHNPHINPRVCADSLRIVTEGDVLSLTEYKNKLFLN